MANVMFKRGLKAELSGVGVVDGQLLICTDTREMFTDVGTERIRLGDFQEFATLDALKAHTNPSETALYYVADLNVLAKWDGTDYVQINLDTGATSVEVVGTGNAVTAANYNATTRKLTLTMGGTFATAAELEAADEAIRGYVDEKTKGIATDAALGELQGKVTAAEGEIDALQEAVEGLGTLAGKDEVSKTELAAALKTEIEGKANTADLGDLAGKDEVAEADLAAALAEKINGKLDASVYNEYKTANDQAVAAAQGAADGALAEAQKKVASVAAADNSVTIGGTATAPTVAAKISASADNALELAEDGLKVVVPAAPEYTIEKAADSGEYAAIYALKKDGVQVGASINIPKDMVVKSGSVDANGNIVLVLNDEANTEITIDASTLIEYVTSGSAAGDMVVVNVSDDHKVTATITDGTITLAKLATEVQTAIGKAHTHENATVLAGITADKIEAWDASEQNSKDYADGLNTAMNGRVAALEAIDHDHANKGVLDGISAEKVASWDGAQAAAEATAAGALAAAKQELEGKITAAQTAAEKVANDNNSAMDTRVKALEQIDHTAYVAADAQVLADAKAFAQGLHEWGSF